MLRRTYIPGPKTVKTAMISGVIVVLATAFLLATFAGIAMAMERMQGNADMLNGKITAVDASHQTKYFTLQSKNAGEPVLNILVTKKTEVKMCNATEPFKDLKAGSRARVTYHELRGMAVADYIYTPC